MPPITDASPILGLPYIQPSQAQKHVTHNEALRLLDVLTQLQVQARTLTAPPSAPSEGDRYIVADSATGTWSGHDDEVAFFDAGGDWQFIAPQNGWQAHILNEGLTVSYTGTGWQDPGTAQNEFDQLGVNATPDATNRLSVSSPAVLLSHNGSDHQVKLNKASTTDTGSVLFQTNWSGRAEIGLAGDDNFSLKVSDDGSSFTTALNVNNATGQVSLPAGLNVTGSIGGTAVQSAPDDATSGRLMPVGAFGLGDAGVTLSVSDDLDDSRPNGIYSWSSTPINAPASYCQMIQMERAGHNSRSQIAFRSGGGATDTYFRGYTGGAWQAWRKLLHNGNAVGTVSQSGGVPNGAIIEQGSNSNGRWVKFADGTMQCSRSNNSVTSVSSTEGNIYRSSSKSWTYPKPFYEAPVVTGSADDLKCWLSTATPGTTSCSVRVKSGTSISSSVNFRLIAHGRWDSF